MAKSLKYFLSSFLILLFTLFGCNQTIEIKEQVEENLLLMQRKPYYQASKYRQDFTDKLIAINPNNAGHYQGKSMAHTKIGDYNIAFPLLEKAYELDPKETGYYYGWLLLYYYRDYDRSILRLNEYDDLTPNQPDFCWGEHINFLKGLCYKQMGEYEKAIREFDQLVEYEGEYVDLYGYVYRGISYLKLNRNNEAIENFDLAINEYENCTMAYYYKGIALYNNGFNEKAKAAFLKSLILLKQGYVQQEAYYEFFDAVSTEMVEDKLKNF
jgi:tetratricopeptide (TPR) repeat protein